MNRQYVIPVSAVAEAFGALRKHLPPEMMHHVEAIYSQLASEGYFAEEPMRSTVEWQRMIRERAAE